MDRYRIVLYIRFSNILILRCLFLVGYRMLLNSPYYLCQQFTNTLSMCSPLYNTQCVPKNFHLTSNRSFLFCDVQNHKTKIKQFQLDSLPSSNINLRSKQKQKLNQKSVNFTHLNYEDPNKILTIDQIEGVYTTHAFSDQAVLFLNRAGDFYYYNLLNKNVFMAQKQHPGLYSDAQILTLEGHFLTCGGCVKNSTTGHSQRIIKVWKVNQEEDTLQLCTRINTGHSKAIQNSFLMNEKVVTLSCDKSIRISNISTECIQRVINVNQDLFAGCNIDYNTLIVGGIGKQLRIYDTRTSTSLMRPINIQKQLIQVTKIIRFNDNNLLLSNINQLLTLDLRVMKLREQGKYEGERISDITVINRVNFVVGNKEKTMQIWRAD